MTTTKSCSTCVFDGTPVTATICATCIFGSHLDYPNWRSKEVTTIPPQHDAVTKPSHYQLLYGVEVIHVRKALLEKTQKAGWSHYQADCWSRSWEYLTRSMAKNGIEDLKKAQTYLSWLIEDMER